MRSFFQGDMQTTLYSTRTIQNCRGSRGDHRLHDQPSTLIHNGHRDRVPVDIQSDIFHTIHLGVPFL